MLSPKIELILTCGSRDIHATTPKSCMVPLYVDVIAKLFCQTSDLNISAMATIGEQSLAGCYSVATSVHAFRRSLSALRLRVR